MAKLCDKPDLNFAACGQLCTACKLCGSFASDTSGVKFIAKPWTTQHLQFSSRSASHHTSLPCPSHLHPSVRLHNTGLCKGNTVSAYWEYSLILLRTQNMEHSGLHLKDVSVFPFLNSTLGVSFLASWVSYWGMRSEAAATCPDIQLQQQGFKGKDLKAPQPAFVLPSKPG